MRDSVKVSETTTSEQTKAIQGAMDHKICIITGGAGVGKTTVISEIVKNLNIRGLRYRLLSFTGKAVSRLKEVTGSNKCSTIHRFLNKSRAETDVIIIDEASMVTDALMHQLFDTCRINRIVLVGDPNQLEPIGWGKFFKELVKSETIPCY
ncbi:ATP-dependent RecD/TraA family DNA helicase, partial [mine drainage metagenome]